MKSGLHDPRAIHLPGVVRQPLLKVHQSQAPIVEIRFDCLRVLRPALPSRPLPPRSRQIHRRNNIVGCYDNRAASRRIASHRAKPPRKLALLHHNDFSLSLLVPAAPASRCSPSTPPSPPRTPTPFYSARFGPGEIHPLGFTIRNLPDFPLDFWKNCNYRSLPVEISLNAGYFCSATDGGVFLIGASDDIVLIRQGNVSV